jgi:hypothetical protein
VIRPATIDDIEPLVLLGDRFFSSDRYRGPRREIDPRSFAVHLCNLLNNDEIGFFVAERDRKVVGFIAVALAYSPYDGRLIASKMHWAVDPELGRGEGIRLAKHAEEWARAEGAVELFMSGMNEDVERLLDGMGFAHVESNFTKVL